MIRMGTKIFVTNTNTELEGIKLMTTLLTRVGTNLVVVERTTKLYGVRIATTFIFK